MTASRVYFYLHPGSKERQAHLAHAVVGELDVSLAVHEDVIQLEIAVDNLSFVEEVQGYADLGGVESGEALG